MFEEPSTVVNSDFSEVAFTQSFEIKSKCSLEQPYKYYADVPVADLDLSGSMSSCVLNCANTAGCFAYHFENKAGKLFFITFLNLTQVFINKDICI